METSNKITLKNITPAKNLVEFSPKERWIQMKTILNGNYYVSSEGRVMSLTKNGLFRIMNPLLHGQSLMVILTDYVNKNQKQFTLPRLVLSHFIGGHFKGRKFGYKNGNRFDCRLKNLYWIHGFNEGVDYEYLSNIKLKYVSDEDRKVIDFFNTKNINILFDLVKTNLHKVKKGLVNKNLLFDFNNNISSIVISLYDRLLKGDYKPVSNKVTYKKIEFITFLITVTCSLAAKEKKYIHSPNNMKEDYFLNSKVQRRVSNYY